MANAVGIYAVVSFVIGAIALLHGGADFREGEYWAGNRKVGIPYRKITEAEYWRLEAHEVRVVSGFGMMVSGIPLLAFVWDRRTRQREEVRL